MLWLNDRGKLKGTRMDNDSHLIQKENRFSRLVFLIAGSVGLIQMVPLYFYENTLNQTQPPAITHPEFYYGFIGIVIAWQIAFLIISRDPVRYRPLMPAIFLEKLLFPIGTFVLYVEGRVHSFAMVGSATLDLVWLGLFITIWVKLRTHNISH